MSAAPDIEIDRVRDHASVVVRDLENICDRLTPEFQRLTGKRLLITGGAGFLGYYLVQSLLWWNRMQVEPDRVQVTVFDSYIRGVPRWLAALEGDAQLTLRVHDVSRVLPLDMGRFDYIVHAASIASPTYYRQHPLETMDTNVNGLRLLLDHARHAQDQGRPIDGLLFFSTSEIYGDPPADQIPTPEEYRGYVSCTGPRACYDESKRYGETLSVTFASRYGVPVRIARPFNNYGPGLKITDRRVIPDFARNILAGEDITLLSDGLPTRTFCYVADAVVGYYKILLSGRNGEAYNIGAEAPEISMGDLADCMVDVARTISAYQGRVVRAVDRDAQYLVDNPQRRCPSIRKAKSQLGFVPEVALDEGLRRALLWYMGPDSVEERR